MANTENDRPFSLILQDVMKDVTDLVRSEVKLAKTEVKQEAMEFGRAASIAGGRRRFGALRPWPGLYDCCFGVVFSLTDLGRGVDRMCLCGNCRRTFYRRWDGSPPRAEA